MADSPVIEPPVELKALTILPLQRIQRQKIRRGGDEMTSCFGLPRRNIAGA